MEWMKIIGWIWIVAILWCSWEFYNAPIQPDDWCNEEGVARDYQEIEDEE